jgi:inositol phosphorylceramide synthase catalytic subunit
MPSLHAAYPLAGLYYAFRQPSKLIRIFYLTIMISIWIAAVYLYHHYVVDVLAGILCALAGLFIFEKILMKSKWYSAFFNYYLEAISEKKTEVRSRKKVHQA